MGIDYGQVVTIGANLGVIAGLIFLAMEIRQNNKFLAAQARYSLRQYGEYAAGMLQRSELPVGAWRLWFHDKGPFPLPAREIYDVRKSVLNPDFVEFFEKNVVSEAPT